MAGFEREDVPIGFWSTNSHGLHEREIALKTTVATGESVASPRWRDNALYNISLTRVDFPEPLTPETTVITPKGEFDIYVLKIVFLRTDNFNIIFSTVCGGERDTPILRLPLR